MSLKYKFIKPHKGYVKIVEFKDTTTGLKGFIAINNTNLGPALGGTRIHKYRSTKHALEDVLSLSKAMTYKCAIANMPFGGGKGVIIADPHSKNKKKLLKGYAEMVKILNGEFYTGEDVGLTESDVQYMLKFCPYFIGKSHMAGDPSPYAGLSAYLCMKEAVKFVFGENEFNKLSYSVKGLGKTGSSLIELLVKNGVKTITAADLNIKKVKEITKKYPFIKIISPDKIISCETDVFCPCALGGDINKNTIKLIKAKIIVGTANNQVKSQELFEKLYKKNILHVPDYVSNAGGLINVANELLPGDFAKQAVIKSINRIPKIFNKILKISKKTKKNPDFVANVIAEKKFK